MAADWSYIRSTRANPPGRAASHEGRRRDYIAALTQFEQLYEAARTVGVASRPMLLYYGLSQAGRALLAAGKEGQWRAHGHGLKVGDPRREILEMTVRTERTGLFQTVSELVGSDVPSSDVELGALWHALPGLSTIDADRWRSALPAQQSAFSSLSGYTYVSTIAATNPAFVMPTPELEISMPPGTESLEDALRVLSHYPRLAGGQVRQGPISTVGPSPFIASLSWQDESGEPRRVGVWEVAGTYPERGNYVVPALGGASMMFVMIWWVLLYVMSMLARYEPAIWVQALDVDRSAIAVPLEAGLDRPVDVVPVLVQDQLRRL